MLSTTLPKLKDGWKYVPIVEWFDKVKTGVRPFEGTKEYFSTGSIKHSTRIAEGDVTYTSRPTRANREVLFGDILQARMAGSNKAILVDESIEEGLFSTGFVQFRPQSTILSQYLFLYFQSPLFLQQRDQHSSGSTQVAINDGNFEEIVIPKPSNDKELFAVCQQMGDAMNKISELDDIIGPLNSDVDLLESSILKSAFEGELVQNEFEKTTNGDPDFIGAERLLENISLSRESEFEKSNPRKKYKQPVIVDDSNLPQLPLGWCWVTLDQLLREPLKNGKSARVTENAGVRCLSLTAVTNNDFSEENTKNISLNQNEVQGYWLEKNDLLIERSNTKELVGTTCLYDGPENYSIYPDLVIRARLNPTVNRNYVTFYLQSPQGRNYFTSNAKGLAGNMPKINQEIIRAMPIPFAPPKEQDRISERIEELLIEKTRAKSLLSDSIMNMKLLRSSTLIHSIIAIDSEMIN